VYKAEKMAPPLQLGSWFSAYGSIVSNAANAGWWRKTVSSGAWVGVSVAVSLFLVKGNDGNWLGWTCHAAMVPE
jgi:hypothetical protein